MNSSFLNISEILGKYAYNFDNNRKKTKIVKVLRRNLNVYLLF